MYSLTSLQILRVKCACINTEKFSFYCQCALDRLQSVPEVCNWKITHQTGLDCHSASKLLQSIKLTCADVAIHTQRTRVSSEYFKNEESCFRNAIKSIKIWFKSLLLLVRWIAKCVLSVSPKLACSEHILF